MSTAITPEAHRAGEEAADAVFFSLELEPMDKNAAMLGLSLHKQLLKSATTVEELTGCINAVTHMLKVTPIPEAEKICLQKVIGAYMGAVVKNLGVANPLRQGKSAA